MRIGKAREVKSRLSAPEQKRLRDFCRNLSTDKNPEHFDDDMEKVLLDIVNDKDRAWLEQTMKHLAAVGFTQSRYEAHKIDEQLERFAKQHVRYNGWIDHFKVVKQEMIDVVSTWKLKALEIRGNEDVQELIPRDEANAGWDYIETGKRTKGEYREGLLQYYFDSIEKAKKEGSFNCIMMPGTRTQASMPFEDNGDRKYDWDTKTRAVIMLALRQVMGETIFAKPVQMKMSNVDWYAGGKDDRVLHLTINRKMRRSRYWISLDYSKYDQSIPGWLIFECFDIIEAMFDKSAGFDEELWHIVKNDFVHKVMINGNGELIESHDGVPSGSMFTQIMDTLVNIVMIKTYFESKGINKNSYSMIIMGDDNLLCTLEPVDDKDLAGYLMRNFGVKVNDDKSSKGRKGQAPEFLSRVWTSRGVYRCPEVLVAKLLYPEHFRKYEKSKPHKVKQAVYMIISCFIHDFPLGMKWVNENKIRLYSIEEMNSAERIQFTSGLMRYRLRTLNEKRLDKLKYVA